MLLSANLVDIHNRKIFPAELFIEGSKIKAIKDVSSLPDNAGYILPGFVDAHVHIESSMLPPTEFARLAVVHGTIGTVSDPHEIANVLGVGGVHFMLDNAQKVPFKFCFGAPSCVPATNFETAGAQIDAFAVKQLLELREIGYLSEMMNFPGVLSGEDEVLKKIEFAKQNSKPIDGHAPGLSGENAKLYFDSGITTDHECFTYEEGKGKASLGIKILIREGSAAKNFEALWPLLNEFPDQVMFCSDDKHPDDLIKGHINQLVARAIAKGCDLFDVLQAACLHPVQHYQLPVGLLREGDSADFILVEDLINFKVKSTWINGQLVAQEGASNLPFLEVKQPNNFKAKPYLPENFKIKTNGKAENIRIIKVLDGEIVTEEVIDKPIIQEDCLIPDPKNDLLKITVVNRYVETSTPAIGFVRSFGLSRGALASSVAHDSHNIVAVGADDQSICMAINAVIRARGGISASDGENTKTLALPIAGLMSDKSGYAVAEEYAALDHWVKSRLECPLQAPFMTLSFLALPVIPALKMTDLGLFDVNQFNFVPIEID